MRPRVVLLACLAALVLSAPAFAVERTRGDGTLSVKDATGAVSLAVRGAVIGQLDQGKVTIQDTNANDGKPPVVWGYESKKDLTDTKALYAGTDIRFRVIGGFFRLKVVGTGLDLSVVGKGSVTLGPALGLLTGGTYSFDGGLAEDFPEVAVTFPLGAPGNG